MSTPAFSMIRSRFPEAHISLLTTTAGKQLFDHDDRIDDVIIFNWPWPYQKTDNKFTFLKIRELINLAFRLRQQNIDLLVDFRGDVRFILLFGVFAGAKIMVSNSRSGAMALLDHSSVYDHSKHEVQKSIDVVKCLGGPEIVPALKLALDSSEIDAVKKLLELEPRTPFRDNIVVVAPYSSKDVKSWPVEYFQQIISHLLKKAARVIIVGGTEDKDAARNLIADFGGEDVFSLAGKTSIRQLAALTSIAKLVIGVDTGVLHIAACFDVPIIAIFGPTRSIEFRPYSDKTIVLQSNTCRCDQFVHLKCDIPVQEYAKCMADLNPTTVNATIDKIWVQK
jgi:ADP-heptose:LPS heptosyltransferase